MRPQRSAAPRMVLAALVLLIAPPVAMLLMPQPQVAPPIAAGGILVVGDSGPEAVRYAPVKLAELDTTVWASGIVHHIPERVVRDIRALGLLSLRWRSTEEMLVDLQISRELRDATDRGIHLNSLFELLDSELVPDGWSGTSSAGSFIIRNERWMPGRVVLDLTRAVAIVVLAWCVGGGVWREVRRGVVRERRHAGLCAGCGYARTGLASDRPCPECGRAP